MLDRVTHRQQAAARILNHPGLSLDAKLRDLHLFEAITTDAPRPGRAVHLQESRPVHLREQEPGVPDRKPVDDAEAMKQDPDELAKAAEGLRERLRSMTQSIAKGQWPGEMARALLQEVEAFLNMFTQDKAEAKRAEESRQFAARLRGQRLTEARGSNKAGAAKSGAELARLLNRRR